MDEVRKHIQQALELFRPQAEAVLAMMSAGVGSEGPLRFAPILEARAIAMDEQRWARKQLEASLLAGDTELLIGYYVLLVQIEVKIDAVFILYPSEDIDAAAQRVGPALADILMLPADDRW
jgi:hypothetical protein